MGGWGSGGGRGAPREENFLRLDAAVLKRLGYLSGAVTSGTLIWSRSGREQARIWAGGAPDHLLLSYTLRKGEADERLIRERVNLAFTEPHFGGRRAWLICPECGGRKRTLWGAAPFICGPCRGLVHNSQFYSALDRVHERMRARRKRLSAAPTFWSAAEPLPPRPKRMRKATYAHLLAEDDQDRMFFEAEQVRRFGQLWI